LSRFSAFWDPFSEENYKSAGWQQAHSIMGLASGGPLGTGLGSSKQKWGNLPEAHTDFIFGTSWDANSFGPICNSNFGNLSRSAPRPKQL
jgi:cell division protein FtsW (lipid II flippase)